MLRDDLFEQRFNQIYADAAQWLLNWDETKLNQMLRDDLFEQRFNQIYADAAQWLLNWD